MNVPANILVVENDSKAARELETYLSQLNYQVTAIAANGETAINLALQTRPDLLLMEVQLKGTMDGIEAACQLNQRIVLPIIFLVSQISNEIVERAKQTQVYGYVFKPLRRHNLAITLELALSQSQLNHKLHQDLLQVKTVLSKPWKACSSYCAHRE